MKKYKTYILVLIIFLASLLRFWHLDILPPALQEDELAWGYNAYSIGIDGKDEFGRKLPLDYIESFGDFKPPVYLYLDTLPVKLMGLTPFAVRFPSAFFGVLSVLMTYVLVKRLFPNSAKKEWYALMSSFVLAVSPWHILLSRAGFEANVATFFLVSGVWSFLAAIQGKKWLLIISTVSFVLSMYTFNTSRIVAPLLVIALVIGFHKELLKIKKQAILSCIIGVLLILPTIGFFLSPNASLRFKEVNIFSNLDVITAANHQIEEDNNSILGKLLHNRRFGYTQEYLQHYFDNFDLNFLFLRGDNNPRFSIQSVGQMYLWDLLFFFLGMFYLFKNRDGYAWILTAWILLGIIPAATARETPHALRIETTLPAFQILIAYGFVTFLDAVKGRVYGINIRYAVTCVVLVLLVWNIGYFLHDYFVHYPKRFSAQWQYGYKEAILFAKSIENEYEAIYIPQEFGRPYIYYVFYNQYNPEQLRKQIEVTRDTFGFVEVSQIGKYHFPSSLSPAAKGNVYMVYLKNEEEFSNKIPQNAKILKVVNRLDGNKGIVVFTI